jgi:uridine phosphorylase
VQRTDIVLIESGPQIAAHGSPLLSRDDYAVPSVFLPQNMLREARRQKGLHQGRVPPVCILDPDADIVRLLRTTRGAARSKHWACYHTAMWEWQDGAASVGIIGGAVGGSFAVLVAEQLFASGCELLISIASAGQIAEHLTPYVLIERALRDEGTSHHYLPASPFVEADSVLIARANDALRSTGRAVMRGASWTTDAPFRETAATIAARRNQGILIVEMEAASLLAFGLACGRPVICLAHVTNQLGCVEGDFEKGELNGAAESLSVAMAVAGGSRLKAI